MTSILDLNYSPLFVGSGHHFFPNDTLPVDRELLARITGKLVRAITLPIPINSANNLRNDSPQSP